jgi:hypothetical protein
MFVCLKKSNKTRKDHLKLILGVIVYTCTMNSDGDREECTDVLSPELSVEKESIHGLFVYVNQLAVLVVHYCWVNFSEHEQQEKGRQKFGDSTLRHALYCAALTCLQIVAI